MKVSPSILTCDFTRLAQEAQALTAWGADRLHLDVADGEFVPNITFGPQMIRSLRPHSDLPFDVHLMTLHPDRLLDAFLDAGADMVTIHLECSAPLRETLERIRAAGRLAGLAIRPGTPVEAVYPYLPLLDLVLIMTVEPGFGGQKLMPEMLKKATTLAAEADRRHLALDIVADGGVNGSNLAAVAAAGVRSVVMGSALFGADEPERLVHLAQSL